jgi:hypothetical protein
MHKRDLDHLLEAAVAKAIGVKLPANRRRPPRATRKQQEADRMSHAA